MLRLWGFRVKSMGLRLVETLRSVKTMGMLCLEKGMDKLVR